MSRMKIIHNEAIQENTETCCAKTTIKELTTQETGVQTSTSKFFEMHPGGYSPLHQPSRGSIDYS